MARVLVSNTSISGEIRAFAGSVAPDGYLLCQGQAVSRTIYNKLFLAIGITYGSGDGSTTFNLPDLRGVFLRGVGSQTIGGITYSGTLGQKQNDATKKNGLALSDLGHTHAMITNLGGSGATTGGYVPTGNNSYFSEGTANIRSATTGITLGTGDAETRPANVGINYIIKA